MYENAVFENGIDKNIWKKEMLELRLKNLTEEEKVKKINCHVKKANRHSAYSTRTSDDYDVVQKYNELKIDENSYGVKTIKVPSFSVSKEKENYYKKFIKDIDKAINEISCNGALIIDLTENNGGSTEPLLLGFSSILPINKPLLYEVDAECKYPITIKRDRNKFIVKRKKDSSNELNYISKNDLNIDKIKSDDIIYRSDIRIAVLLSNNTSSAAEILTLALKANKNVKLFGCETGGYTSSNTLSCKDSNLTITKYWLEDLENNVYKNEGIYPCIHGINEQEINNWLVNDNV